MNTIGFLINPVAGMGGAVGLKGTDGMLAEAVRRGARPIAASRARETMELLKGAPFRYVTCSGPMGEDVLAAAGISDFSVVYRASPVTTAEDTRDACRAFVDERAEMILFCGGDGTARDLYDVVSDTIPLLGIPAGVKMYSAVFAVNPPAAAAILLSGATFPLHLRDAEVMDVDEEAYRAGELRARLYGYAKSPYLPGHVQGAKRVFEDQDEDRAKAGIGRFIAEVIRGTPEILYIIGPGSTTGAITRALGLEKTLLGFDAVQDGRLVASDLNEQGMLALLSGAARVRLVISIIGAQGSVLGRGTQQVSPRVLQKIGTGNVIVVATPHKLAETPLLFVDTGDRELDAAFGDHLSVVSGYHIAQRKKIG
ncbi:MAG: ATP-NAD kinase family protein [Methanomicrobiales archaeon]|nr:ATP-NAD kinase family protein [Methanomicrobiales archaeon]